MGGQSSCEAAQWRDPGQQMKLGSGQHPRSHRVPFWRRTRMGRRTRVRRRTRMSKRRDLVAVSGAKSLNWTGVGFERTTGSIHPLREG